MFFQSEAAAATATTSLSHARLRDASATTELLYKINDTLNHYLFSLLKDAILTGSHQLEDLLRMHSITAVSRPPKASRSSLLEVFCKKGVLKNFVKFTGKQPVPESLFNKVAGLRPVFQTLQLEFQWNKQDTLNIHHNQDFLLCCTKHL